METFDRPLSDFDARQLKTETPSRGAIREIPYGSRKSEFGDSLVKVLFWKRTVLKKRAHTWFFLLNFFHELARLASDRLTAPLHKPARTPCRERL
jgi:hypothetical protein